MGQVRLKLSEPLWNNDNVMIMLLQFAHVQKELTCHVELTEHCEWKHCPEDNQFHWRLPGILLINSAYVFKICLICFTIGYLIALTISWLEG